MLCNTIHTHASIIRHSSIFRLYYHVNDVCREYCDHLSLILVHLQYWSCPTVMDYISAQHRCRYRTLYLPVGGTVWRGWNWNRRPAEHTIWQKYRIHVKGVRALWADMAVALPCHMASDIWAGLRSLTGLIFTVREKRWVNILLKAGRMQLDTVVTVAD